ncbi:MAG: 16S rRNA (cytidine(1402)-2'-O)-methyltransferase [Candidatus Hydrogenedentes bacterium]|nr:16S rRNA (cytidine(1402)-2'-O)-methyltransferase [Candidatus Hydrogenedentota bacterium]
MAAGRLFVVATPIGNLDDITMRALSVLRQVELIAAEDTRHSRRLLQHYGIPTPLTSYHEHNEAEKAGQLLTVLQEGRDIALITDAGTPGISDPGYRVVRAAHERGLPVIPVPGPSAVVAALAASGLPSDAFAFHGFFPRKRGAALALIERIARDAGTHIFFESPNRIGATLALLEESAAACECCVARELTKIHEDIRRATPAALAAHYLETPARGECVLLVHFPEMASDAEAPGAERIRELVDAAMRESGLTRRDAIRKVSADLNISRRLVYAAAQGDA